MHPRTLKKARRLGSKMLDASRCFRAAEVVQVHARTTRARPDGVLVSWRVEGERTPSDTYFLLVCVFCEALDARHGTWHEEGNATCTCTWACLFFTCVGGFFLCLAQMIPPPLNRACCVPAPFPPPPPYIFEQSVWRMHAARKAFLARRRKAEVVQACYRRQVARKQVEKVWIRAYLR